MGLLKSQLRLLSLISTFAGFEILTILSLLSFLDTIFGTLAPIPTLNDVVLNPATVGKSSDVPAAEAGMAALALGATAEPLTPPRKATGAPTVPLEGPSRASSGPAPMRGLSTNEIEVRDPSKRDEDCSRCLKLLQASELLN